jgi:hypothetical protein
MEADILARIRNVHEEVGTIGEDILTDLVLAEGTLCPYGFRFLRVSGEFAVFEVPHQNIAAWYKEGGWLSDIKERIAQKIAHEYRLQLFQPPDVASISHESHHHFEWFASQDCLIVAHPRYLKIRFSNWPTVPQRTLMKDLSALYVEDTSAENRGRLAVTASHNHDTIARGEKTC